MDDDHRFLLFTKKYSNRDLVRSPLHLHRYCGLTVFALNGISDERIRSSITPPPMGISSDVSLHGCNESMDLPPWLASLPIGASSNRSRFTHPRALRLHVGAIMDRPFLETPRVT